MGHFVEQHRLEVQMLSVESGKDKKVIEHQLFKLRESETMRRKQAEQEITMNSPTQNLLEEKSKNYYLNQNNNQERRQQQHSNNYQNNYDNNYQDNNQINDRYQYSEKVRPTQQHTSSSSKSISNNYPRERYDGMMNSDSRSGKTKKLKTVN